jgi:hypothetical protein
MGIFTLFETTGMGGGLRHCCGGIDATAYELSLRAACFVGRIHVQA